MRGWVRELFGVEKPVIAMAHLGPLPSTPLYDRAAGVDALLEGLRRDVRHLLDGGVDAVLFCNEGDRPYTFHADMADVATMVNERTENIGARRLHTVMEKLLDAVSFDAPDLAEKSLTIDAAYVDRMLSEIARNEDLSRYIL